jgi:hypothetical protein
MKISVEGIIALCGGGSVIVSGLATWISQLFSNRKIEKWRSETESKLKILEYQLSEKSSILNNLIEVQKSNYSLSQEKRIASMTSVWKAINDFSFKIPKSIIFIQNALTENEIENFLDEDRKSNSKVKDIDKMDQNAFIDSYSVMQNNLAIERPFLGEDLYFLINIYNAFLTRVVIFTLNGIANEKIKHWHNDKPTINLLSQVLNSDQMNYLMNNYLMSFDYANTEMEKLIISKFNDLLSGKTASQNTIQHIEEARIALANIFKENLKTAP